MGPVEQSKFGVIKRNYDIFYSSLLKHGKLPMWSTSKGYWSASISKEVFALFKNINLKKYKNFLDIGSGDGKVVLIASLFTKATGIEADKGLYNTSLNMQEKLKLNACFINGDYFKHDFSRYDIIFCSPDKPFYRGLEKKLLKELKGKLIVYSNHFLPNFLLKEKEFNINGTYMGIYVQRNSKNK